MDRFRSPRDDLFFRIASLSSIFLGLGAAYAAYVLFLQTPVSSLSRLALAFVLFVAVGGVNFFLVIRILRDKLAVVFAHAPFAASLCFLIPLLFLPFLYRTPDYPLSPLLRPWTDVAVQVQLDTSSNPFVLPANNLRLQLDKDVINAHSLTAVGAWVISGDQFSLGAGQTASLQWVGGAAETMTLMLEVPPGSGTLTVYWDRSRTSYVLSGDSARQITLTRKFSTPAVIGFLLYLSFYILIVWLFLLLYVLLQRWVDAAFGVWRTGMARLLIALLAILLAVITVQLQLNSLDGGMHSYIHGVQLARHLAVLRGVAPDPWQYRVLSEYLAEGFVRFFQLLPGVDALEVGFIALRLLQNLAIFLMAFMLYRRISGSGALALLGILLAAAAMMNAYYDNDLSFNTYFDVFFYLLALLLIVNRRYNGVILVACLAALNRETSALIPLLLLAALLDEDSPWIRRILPFLLSAAVFVIVFLGMRAIYPAGPLYVPYGQAPGYPLLIYNLTRSFTWGQLLQTLGFIPVIGLLFFFKWPRLWQRFFVIVVPAWFVIHFVLSVAAETRLFLVPLLIVFIPGVLFGLKALQDKFSRPLQAAPGKMREPAT